MKDKTAPRDTKKLIPPALYPCIHCCEEYSMPADELWWSDADGGWVCDNCGPLEDPSEPKGISLADEIKRQTNHGPMSPLHPVTEGGYAFATGEASHGLR